MKRTLLILAALALVAAPAIGQIAGTDHDMSAAEANGEVCVFCHTPHNAAPDVPLWNHTLSTVTTYQVYSSPTLDSSPTDFAGGTNVSSLCMSCHDGTVGLGSLVNPGPGGAPSNAGTTMGAVNANLGTDLTNDHPVAFTYDAALQTADGELVDPTTLTGAVHLFGSGGDQVECASCHDPHDNTNQPFLVMSNNSSALCTTCHIK